MHLVSKPPVAPLFCAPFPPCTRVVGLSKRLLGHNACLISLISFSVSATGTVFDFQPEFVRTVFDFQPNFDLSVHKNTSDDEYPLRLEVVIP